MISLKKFDRYGEFYDFLYHDKDYRKESEFIHTLIGKHGAARGKKLLDLGCGPGRHLLEFNELGYTVAGSEPEVRMREIALVNANKRNLNLRMHPYSFNEVNKLTEKFDIVISLFSAFSYVLNFEQQVNALRNIHGILERNGLFIFDVWNGHAVTQDKHLVKVMRKKKERMELLRISKTELRFMEQEGHVDFTWLCLEDGTIVGEFNERQILHFYYLAEIKNLVMSNGFRILEMCPFGSEGEIPSEKDWNISFVAQKM